MLNAFNCREILGKYYLAQDLAAICYTAEWRQVLPALHRHCATTKLSWCTAQYAILAVVGVAMYPLGILFYSFLILRRNRHKLYISPKLKRRYGDHTSTAPSLRHHFAIPTWHRRNAFRSLRAAILLLVPLRTRHTFTITITVPSPHHHRAVGSSPRWPESFSYAR